MKPLNIVFISIIIFLILSIFGGVKNCQLKRMTEEKVIAETLFKNSQKEKENLKAENLVKEANLSILRGQKTAIEIKLEQYTTETNKQLEGFKNRISALNSLPADTVYQHIFAKYPHFNQVLQFRFSESQIRGIHLSILERDNYENLYAKTTRALVTCTDLNAKNNEIIRNLGSQNENLKGQIDISELQIINLQDNLKLTEKDSKNKDKKIWFYKLTTIAVASGCVVLLLR